MVVIGTQIFPSTIYPHCVDILLEFEILLIKYLLRDESHYQLGTVLHIDDCQSDLALEVV